MDEEKCIAMFHTGIDLRLLNLDKIEYFSKLLLSLRRFDYEQAQTPSSI